MFNNIGGKIKGLSKAICIIGIVISCIAGLIMALSSHSNIIAGILTAGIGSLASWIGSFFTYGFGQLVENSDILVKNSAANLTQNSGAKTPDQEA